MKETPFSPPFLYTSPNPNFPELIKDKVSRQHFMHHNGIRLTRIMEGYMEAQAPFLEHLAQQDGIVHGGVTATLADLVSGFAAFSLVNKDDRVVTSELRISYLSPGRGENIFARGWVIKPGKRLMYCEAEVYINDGDQYSLIAKSSSIMAVIPGKNKEFAR
jgi:uncharacterized protein (TIGR00369 family)